MEFRRIGGEAGKGTAAATERERLQPAAGRVRHQLTLRNRERLSIEGVHNVESFDHNEIVLQTEGGSMLIKGEGLHIRELNVETSTLEVEGRVRSVEYGDEPAAQKAKGLFGRLFR